MSGGNLHSSLSWQVCVECVWPCVAVCDSRAVYFLFPPPVWSRLAQGNDLGVGCLEDVNDRKQRKKGRKYGKRKDKEGHKFTGNIHSFFFF